MEVADWLSLLGRQREADGQSSNTSGSDWSNTNSGMGTPPLVGLGLGAIGGRSLIREVPLGWAAGGGDEWRFVGQLEVHEDGSDDGRIGEEGEDPHGATARGA